MTTIIVPRRRQDFFDDRGEPTLRFVRWMEAVTGTTNDSNEELAALATVQYLSSQDQWLQQQINGLPELTIDTTGFTADTTFMTTDKVIA
jgi:hypothetical protein